MEDNLDPLTLAIYPAGGKVFYGLQQRRIPARSLLQRFRDGRTDDDEKTPTPFFRRVKKWPRGKDGAKKKLRKNTRSSYSNYYSRTRQLKNAN